MKKTLSAAAFSLVSLVTLAASSSPALATPDAFTIESHLTMDPSSFPGGRSQEFRAESNHSCIGRFSSKAVPQLVEVIGSKINYYYTCEVTGYHYSCGGGGWDYASAAGYNAHYSSKVTASFYTSGVGLRLYSVTDEGATLPGVVTAFSCGNDIKNHLLRKNNSIVGG